MEFGGRYVFAAPRPVLWAALNEAEMLKAAIPGCRKLDWSGPGTLAMELEVNLGVLKPVFGGDLVLSDVVPAERYRLSGKGRGGLLGLAQGAADIVLSDHSEGTELRFIAEGGASGQLMKLGRAVIGNSAQRIIDGFFLRFAEKLGVGITVLDAGGQPVPS